MILPSYSREPFTSADYLDGEIYRLEEESILGQAILCERWLNMTTAEQSRWVNLMRSPVTRFAGTILSPNRQQVELTLCFYRPLPEIGMHATVCITLAQFQRFL